MDAGARAAAATGGIRRSVARVVPLLRWAPEYGRADLRPDLVAGVTVAALLVPQAMAYALLAGLPPAAGLYSATVPLVAYAVFGTSRQLAVGPVAIVSLLTASALGERFAGGTAGYVEGAALLALMVGLASAAFGILRLGFLTNLLSHSVLVGYTAAAAIIIGTSQLKVLLGISIPRSDRWHETVWDLVQGLEGTHLATFALGASTIVALVGLRRASRTIPGPLVVVAAATLVVAVTGLDARGVAVVGAIPNDVPALSLPGLDAGLVGDLLPTALIITVVGFMESIAVAKVYARRNRYDVDPNQELIGLGAANVASGAFGGYPVTGGFSRTAVNATAGARTPLASIVTAALVLVTLVALTPLLEQLPQAVLAGVIVVAVAGLVDVAEMRRIATVKRSDLLTLVVAFVATLALGVEWGIAVAVVAALAVMFVRIARPHSAVLGRVPGTTLYRNVERFPEVETVPGVAILRVDVSLNFANAAFLKRRLEALTASTPGVRVIVIDGCGVNDIDATGEQTLAELVEEYDARGISIHLAALKGPVRDVLLRSGLWSLLADRIHPDVHDAVTVACGAAARASDLRAAGIDERG
jgi:SulP family sulfate permease